MEPEMTKDFLNNMFDQSIIWSGKPSGGSEKKNNARHRTWTKRVYFGSWELQQWLDIYMACHSQGPIPARAWRYKNFWEKPEKIEEWWRVFLENHADLPRNDRVERKLSTASRQVNGESIEPVSTSGRHSPRATALSTMVLHTFRRAAESALASEPYRDGSVDGDSEELPKAKRVKRMSHTST